MTDHHRRWPELSGATVFALAPDAVAAFQRMVAAVVVTRSTSLELVRRRVAMLLQLPADCLPPIAPLDDSQASLLSSWPTASVYSPAERARLSFAEQFVLDVAGVTADDRAALTDTSGMGAFGFVQALYVLDHGARLSGVLHQLFGASPLAAVSSAVSPDELWPAAEAMMGAVARLRGVNPLTAELVRLRGARLHQCRLCCSRRRVSAVTANAELLEATEIDTADLTAMQRAALALTDAILLQPGNVPAAVVDEVRAALTPPQAMEVALLVAHNAANKIAVALGADAPVVTDGLEYFEVEAGEYRYGLAPPT